jgi:VanZ family protein
MVHFVRKLRRETVWPFLLAGTITWCSGYPAAVPDVDWFQPDKLGHFAAYGALATAIVRIPALVRWPWLACWWSLPLASAYGLGDELRQSLTAYRSCDWHDWLADTVGAAVAVTLYLRWGAYRRLMDKPIFRRRPKRPAPESVVAG